MPVFRVLWKWQRSGMPGQCLAESPDEVGHLRGHAGADRVRNRNLDGFALGHFAREGDDARRQHLALEWAAEGGGERDLRTKTRIASPRAPSRAR